MCTCDVIFMALQWVPLKLVVKSKAFTEEICYEKHLDTWVHMKQEIWTDVQRVGNRPPCGKMTTVPVWVLNNFIKLDIFSAINPKVFLPEGLRGTDRRLSGLSGGCAERLVAASRWSNLHPASTSACHHLKAEVQDSQGVMASHVITLCWTVTEIPTNFTDFIFLDDVHTKWDNNN